MSDVVVFLVEITLGFQVEGVLFHVKCKCMGMGRMQSYLKSYLLNKCLSEANSTFAKESKIWLNFIIFNSHSRIERVFFCFERVHVRYHKFERIPIKVLKADMTV